VLAVDDAHVILDSPRRKISGFLRCLNALSDETGAALVLVGSPSLWGALEYLQWAHRFLPFTLEPFRNGSDLMEFLVGLQADLPLCGAYDLSGRKTMATVLAMTGGVPGHIVDLLGCAAIQALQDGSERISAETLKRCGYVGPNFRR
jgi:hypothetical protein